MDKHTFDQLVDNIATDGTLTGAVTCYQPSPDAPIEILSGHHRVEAAIAAGLDAVDTIVIKTELPNDRKIAIQLSHNAITGEDDITKLSLMYTDLSLGAKKFSGLNDDVFDAFEKLSVAGLTVGSIRYEEIRVAFLPEDRSQFEERLAIIGKSGTAKTLAARYQDFDALFETVVGVKTGLNIANTATALAVMAELAMERLQQIEQESAEDGDQ